MYTFIKWNSFFKCCTNKRIHYKSFLIDTNIGRCLIKNIGCGLRTAYILNDFLVSDSSVISLSSNTTDSFEVAPLIN